MTTKETHHLECSMSGPNGRICTCPRGWPQDENGKEITTTMGVVPGKVVTSPIIMPEEPKIETADSLEEAIDELSAYHDLYDLGGIRPQRMRNPRTIIPYTPPKPQNSYLPFDTKVCLDTSWVICAQPQLVFKPEALMLWGYNDDTSIDSIYNGCYLEGAASFGPVPAEFFGTAKTYEKLVEDFETNGISPPSWITFHTCNVGNRISIQGRGKLRAAVMLGKSML